MAVNPISEGRVIALFNPTPGRSGFLQPLLAGPPGDNQSYLQLISETGQVIGFIAVPWPERDVAMLKEEIDVALYEESVWAFGFGDEAPLVQRWSDFRTEMQARVISEDLSGQPLLQFDVVDTLDLAQSKRSSYLEAYQAYRTMNSVGADRWRDRAILEPALIRALPSPEVAGGEGGSATAPPVSGGARLRARLSGGQLHVEVDDPQPRTESDLSGAYARLARDHPDLFPQLVGMRLDQRRRPLAKPRDHSPITVILVGRVKAAIDTRQRWLERGVDVVVDEHFLSRKAARPSDLVILLGAQTDGQELAEAGRRIRLKDAVLVSLSSSATPVVRDLEFQDRATLPTISFFAPYATSVVRGRDPVQAISPLIEIFQLALRSSELRFIIRESGEHRVLLREPIRAGQDPVVLACRLGARALRAGAALLGSADLYNQGENGQEAENSVAPMLQRLFEVRSTAHRRHLKGRSPALLLLVERVRRFESGRYHAQLQNGLSRLLEIRGWKVSDTLGDDISVEDGQRRFNVAIAGSGRTQAPQDPSWPTPGLGRSPLLVVHVRPRREQLLVGNRGQFLHIAIEDIALMVPQTQWMWPVLRRQLLENGASLTLAAMRLGAAIAVEAIRTGRAQGDRIDWRQVEARLAAADCERFLLPEESHIESGRAILAMVLEDPEEAPGAKLMRLELSIEDDGPTLRSAWSDGHRWN